MQRRGELTITRDRVIATLRSGLTWRGAAEQLGISPGLAFMVATGIPADGSGVPELPHLTGVEDPPVSPQRLVNERPHNPLTNDEVTAWVKARAARELRA